MATYDAQRPEFAGSGRDKTEQSSEHHDSADCDGQQWRAGENVVDRLVVFLHNQHPDANCQQNGANQL